MKSKVTKLPNFSYLRASTDPVYFIKTYCYTFDPRTEAKDLGFDLYPYQEDYVLELKRSIEAGDDLFVEKSRDMGVSWVTVAVLLWFWLFKPGFQALIGSRKEDYVDDWTLQSLFPRMEYLIDHLPADFVPKGWDKKKFRQHMKLTHPSNGSVIVGESANANFSRAGRYNIILFDELAFWPFSQSSWEAAGDATPCRVAITTPSAQPSFAKALRLSGKVKLLTLHWRLHPLKDEAWYESEKLRRSAEETARELDINWEGSITGRVYPEVDHIRIDNFPYMPQWPLFVSHDFGRKPDPHSIGWWQVNPETGRIRRIESFERNNKIIDWFAPLFGHPMVSDFSYNDEDLAIIREVSEWKGATHFGDPAGNQHTEAAAMSVIEGLAKYKIYVNTNTKANDLESRKTELKRVLMNLDLNDTPGNRYWLECIKNARYPERQENSQATSENVKPIHDWTSHHRSESEYFAVNFKYRREDYEPAGMTFNKSLAMVRARQSGNQVIGN